ncbi:GntR family transcriptional regulator [Niabella sp. CC-SYL272]|uniref:GntR family transcriptional regulator n=1 Tax=Niabella agricola TaxID=2891571 RepID=UPI001F22ECF4|nr:GntR family transcriptional regulator [Niabella agricola]MCF3108215.1 GntR family transcriptional regulator [Niabella agricola]
MYLFDGIFKMNQLVYQPLDHNNVTPLHQQAEEWLRQLIRGEAYQKGHPIPPEIQLARQLRISRSTLRQAISKLVFEGLLVRKKRTGTCVSGSNPVLAAASPVAIQTAEPDSRHRHFELHVSYTTVSNEALHFFGTGTPGKVLRRERLSGTMESPLEYTIAEFNPALPVSASENFNLPLSEILEKGCGLRIETIQETLHAVAADLFLAAKLETVPGTPLLVRKRHIYVTDALPAVFITVYNRTDTLTAIIEHWHP